MGCKCNEPILFTVFEVRSLIQYFKKKNDPGKITTTNFIRRVETYHDYSRMAFENQVSAS